MTVIQANERGAKARLVSTPLYRPLLEVRSAFQFWSVLLAKDKEYPSTAYCISPYKSGTTYLSGLFSSVAKSAHEPMMYATLKNINNKNFMRKRGVYLNLDLECSGFFAGKIEMLRAIAPQAKILYLSRHPEQWIGSVVNYFAALRGKVSHNYVARLVFDPICEWPVDKFYDLEVGAQRHIVLKLMEFWIEVYRQGMSDDQSMVIPLKEVDDRIHEVSEFLGLPAVVPGNAWKRENSRKKNFVLSDYLDLSDYVERVKSLGYDLI